MVIVCAVGIGGLLSAPGCLPDLGALTAGSGSSDGGPGCSQDSECAGKVCMGGMCVDPCHDKVRDGTETDVDCGGKSCAPCAAGLMCKMGSDCQSGTCSTTGVCVAPSCTDGIKDQNETDVDCGGVCAQAGTDGGAPLRCDMGRGCAVANDCQSFLCNAHGTCDPPDMVPVADIIDDMQGGTSSIPMVGGRVGNWFEFDDGTPTGVVQPKGSQVPQIIPGGGPDGSQYGQHTVGMGFSNWGAGIGFDFDNPKGGAQTKLPYDGSGFAGIKFWARSDTPGYVLFQVADLDTYQFGGVCMPVSACSDHFSAKVQLTPQWTLYKFLYSDLKQQTYGEQFPSINPKQLIAVQFMTGSSQTFDYWIVDIAFFN
jgi:hypothetical protein